MGCLIGGGLIGALGWALGGLIGIALLIELWPVFLIVFIIYVAILLSGGDDKKQ